MKKSTSTPNLPDSSRMQMPGGSDKTAPMMGAKPKKGATKKTMDGATKKGMASKKKY